MSELMMAQESDQTDSPGDGASSQADVPTAMPQSIAKNTLPTPEDETESMDDEEAESSFVKVKAPKQKRASFIPSLHVPKPTVPPPPPPPVDLSALRCASREHSKSSATVEFTGGRTVLDFKCKAKSGALGIMKSATVQLDLEAMVMRKVKGDQNAVQTGISMECIISTKHSNKEVDVQYMTNTDNTDQVGTLLGSNRHMVPILTKRYCFPTREEAVRFLTHLDVMRESGKKLKQIFAGIDKRNAGQISQSALFRAMKENGMDFLGVDGVNGMEEAAKMIALADSDISSGIDFVEFFRLFMYTPCITVHQALTEWRNKLALVQRRRTSSNFRDSEENDEVETKKNNGNIAKDWVVDGEIIVNVVENVRYSFGLKARDNLDGSHHHWVGTLSVTNYRLVLQSHITHEKTSKTRHEVSKYFDRMDIPVNTIHSISKLDSSCVLLVCKDLRPILCSFEPNDLWVTTLVTAIQSIAFPSGGGGPKDAFAFHYKLDQPLGTKLGKLENGWDLYDPLKEFERIGVMNSPHARFYRIWSDNYTMSETYPKYFCVPSAMSESDIMNAAKFRSKCRMPAVSWRNRKNGAILCRSAQPMVGLKSSRNAADEKLLNLYRVRGDPHNPLELEEPSTLYILDARKILAATGNQVQGKGTEIISNYAHAELVYCNIENIHVMRDSVGALGGAGVTKDHGELKDGYIQHVKDSLWLRHVQLVLKASLLAAERMELNDSSVLVHCSDGWDRTSQMSSTAMLLLDPYYRTIKGFAVLVEKEWCDFGHKFKDRHGQASEKKKDERSPVFIQFLDVVHQLMLQFPSAFEFNERMLVFLADMVYSCLFGTFLGNNSKEREVVLDVKNKTVSVWTYILAKKATYTNPVFDKKCEDILWPSTSIKSIKTWDRYFCRFDLECHPRSVGGAPGWEDDWGERLA